MNKGLKLTLEKTLKYRLTRQIPACGRQALLTKPVAEKS